ncbi:hypothetical protein N7533_004668 [Penicillium manginii]|uniref:uncharacterized protein n=1 Tax=Penicillium manginii TaxID=203109 RepID=UPI002549037F|nr:uncharacterized protein N7533_004668 [Penicillium manginii]KAJ5755125.1 hypothetical protein N7533_004668 [Penicillium manginii]
MDANDPLVQALPPATDYLTYLTLLEYQLTPERLPLLHQLLQDERLTTNIGWDLVKLLLPMLPASTECLHDVARLGNPREVILRVAEALEHLQPEDGDDEFAEENSDAGKSLPSHILQFNCLLAMLSAALEAYETMPSDETTLALLEFLRDVSPSKRPAPPPRTQSQSSVLRVDAASAPDPEAEIHSPSPEADNETQLVRKFIQFGLIELLKAYLLSFSGPLDPGLSWTVRIQEQLNPNLRLPEQSQLEAYTSNKDLKERDMIMGKIVALSRDVGIENNDLLSIVSRSAEDQPPPLDFEEAGAHVFASGQPIPPLPVFPDLANIFSNFVGGQDSLDEVAFGQPQALLDSLLALTVHSTTQEIPSPSSETEFKDFAILLTACTARQSHGIVRQIPNAVVHSHPSQITRFKLIRSVLENDRLNSARDSAITWLRNELLDAPPESTESIFRDPLYFWTLFPLLFRTVKTASATPDLVQNWTRLTQTDGPALHSALNLYYLLLSSTSLRGHLHLEKTANFFRSQVLKPLREIFRSFESDLPSKGGDGLIEAAVGEEMCQVGNDRSVGLIGLILDQIEDIVNESFGTDEADLKDYSETEETRLREIRKDTESWN